MRLAYALLAAATLFGQRQMGELRIAIVDSSGLPLEAAGTLTSEATQVSLQFVTTPEGTYSARYLPFGMYKLALERAGFSKTTRAVEIRSEVAIDLRITLGVAPVEATVVVTDADTLFDPYAAHPANHVGSKALRERGASAPARGLADLVEAQPGWLLEANGVLHPRGSEYNTQHVVDGLPFTDNRSPAFAPAFDVDEVASMRILTGGYPAEYGRKLGGVVELTTARDRFPGIRGRASLESASFATRMGSAGVQFSQGRTTASISGMGTLTERFLDPPVEANFTNRASAAGFAGSLDGDVSDRDRLRLTFQGHRSGFMVPNELIQQEAGQRQDRTNSEMLGHVSYQRVLSSRSVASFRGMVRDLTAELWSNPLATPIDAAQDRGFREGYVAGSWSRHSGRHELKAGADGVFSSVREKFGYRITDAQFFDDDVPERFEFAARRRGNEQSGFVQDLVRLGAWTLSAGVRWDRYRLLVGESAWSPRLAAAWHVPKAGLMVRASYDRTFETPAIENLLLASSQEAARITETDDPLPVRPGRGHFSQVGVVKSLSGKARFELTYFYRRMVNYADDGLLLNTGISFPIAFARADVRGFESKIELPGWGPFSGYAGWSHLAGTARLPITGGLFLEEEAEEAQPAEVFAITQDQRNTVHARWRAQIGPRVWAAAAGAYHSGLPVEREGDFDDLEGRYGRAVVDRVNLERGRVRPAFLFDLSVGIEAWKRERRSLRIQADAVNLTNTLRVINFAGLFSGTAIGAPRSWALRIVTEF